MKILISGISVLILLAAGIYLHKTGKPYHGLVFNIHKLLTLLVIVLMSLVLAKTLWPSMGPMEWVIMLSLLLSLVGIFISGAMMSLDRQQEPMLWLHRISALVFFVDFIALLWILLPRLKTF